jgi:hypothetical protein
LAAIATISGLRTRLRQWRHLKGYRRTKRDQISDARKCDLRSSPTPQAGQIVEMPSFGALGSIYKLCTSRTRVIRDSGRWQSGSESWCFQFTEPKLRSTFGDPFLACLLSLSFFYPRYRHSHDTLRRITLTEQNPVLRDDLRRPAQDYFRQIAVDDGFQRWNRHRTITSES